MRKLLTLLILGAALVGGWYAVSPWLAMNDLREAALEADSDALADSVDFAAMRSSVKDEMRRRIEGEGQRTGILGSIGSAIAGGVAEQLVDVAVSPAGVAAILTTGGVVSGIAGGEAQEIDWDVERDGFSAFRGVGTKEDGSATPVLFFERRGLGWKLVGLDLSE